MSLKNLQTLVVTPRLSDQALSKLRSLFKTVHYHPDNNVPSQALSEVDVFFSTNRGIPVDSFSKTPRLRHIQLVSAGADKAIASPAFQEAIEHGNERVTLSSSSGIHVVSIPPYIIATTLALYHRLPKQILVARNEARWATGEEIAEDNGQPYFVRSVRGKTVGFLGYGHLARETARLFRVFGVNIIAANTSGSPKEDTGYIIPGTGDKSASIPSEFFSTKERESLKAFLNRTDILVASLPSTQETRYMLDSETLGCLKENAVFINVGRGDLVRSDDLLKALDLPNGLLGAALDVTDPEPLPDGHPLFTHPRVIVTPHLSGDAEGERDLATDVLILNVEKLRDGRELVNKVDLKKGY